MRLLVRGFVCCVLASGARGQWYPSSGNVTVVYPPMPAPTTVVIVNSSPPPRPAVFREALAPERQITYLIAFKGSVVRAAEQYWVEGKTIYFVTTDHQRMTAPVSSVDRILSKRLNSEQNVAFYLPPEQGRTVAGVHVVRHTASVVHKKCYCVTTPSARVPSRPSGEASRSSPGAPASR
jgi:hypothetical protein